MSNSLRRIAAAVSLLLVWCCIASAQQSVEESRPSVYYLPDKQGNLQPVLDFKYQDFVQLYKLKNQLDRRDRPPRYNLQRMTATGIAGEEHAELNIQFQVLVRDDDWVRVPLQLDQGLLRAVVTHKGPGEQFIHYEGEDEGYVCWVRGKPDTQQEISITMLVPLTVIGDETRLKLFAPRATASELKLTVPIADAVGKVSEGATLLPSTTPKKGATEFSVVGLGGDFLLAWHKANPNAAGMPIALEAAGAVLTRLDRRVLTADATLSVRSYGAAFDRFTVRLPPGAELSPGSPNGYVLAPLNANGVAKQKDEQPLVEVRFAKKTVGPVEVRLACRRDYDPIKSQAWCELAGFEVIGAVRQWGAVAVAAADDWQVLWGTSSDVRQIDQLPDSLQKDDVVAGFEYFTQPFSLLARLTPRKPRINVEPKYVLQIDLNEIRLEGILTYTIRGAKLATLDVAIPGWELDAVGPESLVAVDGATVHANNLAIPLLQPTSGTIELQVRMHRAIESKATSFNVSLPQPQAATVGTASIVVKTTDDKGTWTLADDINADSEGQAGSQPRAVQVAPDANLNLRWKANAAEATIVDRAWVQSWLTSSERQDRAAYQLTTNRKELEVLLPRGAEANQAVVSLNGKRVESRPIGGNRLLVPLTSPRDSRRITLELRYHFPESRPPRGAMALEFPRLGPNAWTRRMYWQLVLPVNEHLIVDPQEFVGEFAWSWLGYFWGRQPLLDQAQLETWVGVSPRTPVPERVNVYLFSTLGNVNQAEFRTAGRSWIVLWASGAALVAGLLLIYIPATRHPTTLLIVGLALLAAEFIAPEATLLLAQAASLGLALALLAGLLERSATRRLRRTPLRKEPVSAMAELGSTRTRIRPPQPNGPASTEAMPAVQPPSPGNVGP